jgi:hypothetical protein
MISSRRLLNNLHKQSKLSLSRFLSSSPSPSPNIDEHIGEIKKNILRKKGEKELQTIEKTSKKILTNQEREKIASIGLVSPEETKQINQQIMKNRVAGFGGLFFSLVCLGVGITLFLI